MRTSDECMRLLPGHIVADVTIDDYIQRTRIHKEGTWRSHTEMSHMTALNIFSFRLECMHIYFLGILIGSDIQMI